MDFRKWSVWLGFGCIVFGATSSLYSQSSAVRIEVFDNGIPNRAWPKKLAVPAERYSDVAFAFFRIPQRYGGTGVRVDRGSPFLMRASATVSLPAGEYRLLLRSRSAARVFINDIQIANLAFANPITDGHSPLRRDALKLGVTRYVAPGDSETLAAFTSDGRPSRVVLEWIVGGKRGKDPLRPEIGETLIAVAPKGTNDFHILAPNQNIPLTDGEWRKYRAGRETHYDIIEAKRRAETFAVHAPYWKQRHDLARQYVKLHPPPQPPAANKSLPARNAIDHFLNPKLMRALRETRQAQEKIAYHRDVLPILTMYCYSCHANKPRGKLRLDERTAALKGGRSGKAAVVPGRPMESELARRIQGHGKRMPPRGKALSAAEIDMLVRWIREGADWPDEAPAPLAELAPATDDLQFIRRVYLDVIGTVPTVAEVRAFLADENPNKRSGLIDRLLDDPRWADAWMPYWMDVLAENPNLINPTLNNSGPFRYWLYDVLRDNKSWDVAVTELVSMEGSRLGGGPAGFGLAALNDAPMAAKAGVLANAFLATEMKCARCHDAPYHKSKQADLFQLAAMLARKPVSVPKTSIVPKDKLHQRKALVTVSLKAGDKLQPIWSLSDLVNPKNAAPLPAGDEKNSRHRLAALITAPANERFAQVMVNRVWRRYFGRGLVEPPHDWENAKPSHPELLRWLACEFVANDYDLKHVARLILNSHAYQRQASTDRDAQKLFAAPGKRRLGPELFTDTLFDAFGRAYDTEPVCLDLDSGRPYRNAQNFGIPKRAWQLVYLSNDRDRPSLNLPKVSAVVELMKAFGWNGNRQKSISDRRADASILQSALLANGAVSRRLTRLSDGSDLTEMCLHAKSAHGLIDEMFLRILTRLPTDAERASFAALLTPGFADRIVTMDKKPMPPRKRQPYVTWANHLVDEANAIRLRQEAEVRRGPAPTERLRADWRRRMEDVLWALLNSPELPYYP